MAKIDKVYDAVKGGFSIAPSIATATGIGVKSVSAYLTILRRRGEIEITGVVRKSTSAKWLVDKNRKAKLTHRLGRSGSGTNSYRIKK